MSEVGSAGSPQSSEIQAFSTFLLCHLSFICATHFPSPGCEMAPAAPAIIGGSQTGRRKRERPIEIAPRWIRLQQAPSSNLSLQRIVKGTGRLGLEVSVASTCLAFVKTLVCSPALQKEKKKGGGMSVKIIIFKIWMHCHLKLNWDKWIIASSNFCYASLILPSSCSYLIHVTWELILTLPLLLLDLSDRYLSFQLAFANFPSFFFLRWVPYIYLSIYLSILFSIF
jgi:hypothetical protein